MGRLCDALVAGLRLPASAGPEETLRALCAVMSGLRGRPVRLRTAAFPAGTASGLWLDFADQDVVVVEERTAPGHQLVILGHELWHMAAGHRGGPVDGVAVAARTRFDRWEEAEAERFGLLLASRFRAWSPAVPPAREPAAPPAADPSWPDGLVRRIEASLGGDRTTGRQRAGGS
ncbi:MULTISPECIES: toxin-antitoxin system, toxin component [Streptomyces]|uniref:Toxin-antitoxin system, toxin component n=1 Tax=Streptomyces chilikensis TaxID=1194079 RepID=A0ABV3EYH7_9ACTN|nr:MULTISPECIES: toxin-antitoxin system, toxin component [Streptomyces]